MVALLLPLLGGCWRRDAKPAFALSEASEAPYALATEPRAPALPHALPATRAREVFPGFLRGHRPIPGGRVENRSSARVYALASGDDARWHIAAIEPGQNLGGDPAHLTVDVDYVFVDSPVWNTVGGEWRLPVEFKGSKLRDGKTLTIEGEPGAIRVKGQASPRTVRRMTNEQTPLRFDTEGVSIRGQSDRGIVAQPTGA